MGHVEELAHERVEGLLFETADALALDAGPAVVVSFGGFHASSPLRVVKGAVLTGFLVSVKLRPMKKCHTSSAETALIVGEAPEMKRQRCLYGTPACKAISRTDKGLAATSCLMWESTGGVFTCCGPEAYVAP